MQLAETHQPLSIETAAPRKGYAFLAQPGRPSNILSEVKDLALKRALYLARHFTGEAADR
jgi:hypothetical protein